MKLMTINATSTTRTVLVKPTRTVLSNLLSIRSAASMCIAPFADAAADVTDATARTRAVPLVPLADSSPPV